MTSPSSSPRTYTQVAASPPTTPRSREKTLNEAPHETTQTQQGPPTAAARPPAAAKGKPTPRAEPATMNTQERKRMTRAARRAQAEAEAESEDRNATPGPAEPEHGRPSNDLNKQPTGPSPTVTEYQFDDIDMASFEQSLIENERRYGTPTSEDWRNLSVHGTGSVDSEDAAAIVGDTIMRDEHDIEDFVTDGIDRFGEPIPGQEAAREYAREWKRQRVSASPPPGTAKPLSVRFRKYRTRAAGEKSASERAPTRNVEENRTSHMQGQAPPREGQAPWLRSALPQESPPRITASEKGKTVRGRPLGPNLQAAPTKPLGTREPQGGPGTGSDGTLTGGGTKPREDWDSEYQPRWRSSLNDLATTPQHEESMNNMTAGWHSALEGEEHEQSSQVEVLPAFLTQASSVPPERTLRGATQNISVWPAPHITPANPGADGYGFTPEPTGGFPAVHQPHPEGLIDELAQTRVDEAWKQQEGTVLFVQIANVGHPDVPLRKPIHDEICALIKHVTGETDFVPIAPQAEWVQPPKHAGQPKTWTVLGLKKTSVTELVRLRVLSSVWITLFLYERKLVIPKYLFTLTGYTTNHESDITNSIRGAFLDDPIFSTIADLVESHPTLQYLPPHEAALRIASSVEVRIDQLGNGNMQAAVFCDSPTGNGETWKHWRANLMKLPFHSRYNPTAIARRIELCQCCHSADHLNHKCPFPHLQGWNAPPTTTRTYGRPRQRQDQERESAPHSPAAMSMGGMRGRGRGTGMYRGGRAATPNRGFHA